jgi:hypothetical protein
MLYPIKSLIPALKCCIAAGLYSAYLFDFLHQQTDTDSYLNAMNILLGEPAGPDKLHRLVKPLAIIFPVIMNKLFGLSTETGLYIQQWMAYLTASMLFYLILERIFRNGRVALMGLIMLLGCQPFAVYGLSLMTDGAAWALQLAAIYYYLSIKTNENQNIISKYLILGSILGLGFFIKETIFLAGLFIFFDILLGKSNLASKVLNYIQIGFTFLAIVLIGSLLTQYLYNTSILNWWQFAHSDSTVSGIDITAYIQQFFRTMDLFWIVALGGIIISIGDLVRVTIKKELLALLLTGIIGFLIFPFLWDYRSDRILFMIALNLIPFAALFLSRLGFWGFIPVFGGAMMNIYMTYRIYHFEEPGWIVFMSICFICLLFLTLAMNRFKFQAP